MRCARAVLGWSAIGATLLLAGLVAVSWSPFAGSWWVALLRVARPALMAGLVLSLLWCRLAGARRIAWIAAGVLGVSLTLALWPGPSTPSQPPTRADGRRLKVVTFNIWGGNPRKPQALAWLASSGADVVLLQEVSGGLARNGLPSLASAYPYQSWSPRSDGRWANATLSRFPLTAALPAGAHAPLPFERFLISVDGRTVAVYNVHLSMPVRRGTHFWVPVRSGAARHLARYDEGTRDREIATLIGLLEREPHLFVVGGDFNLCERSRAYSSLRRVARDSFYEAGQGLGATWPVAEAEGLPRWVPPAFRIDYVWLAPRLACVTASVGPELGSDHRPVLSVLQLPGGSDVASARAAGHGAM
jgi:vancomycin resistance protein VanJ